MCDGYLGNTDGGIRGLLTHILVTLSVISRGLS